MEQLYLPAMTCSKGLVNLPGSKSISNRLLLLSSLAIGDTQLDNLLISDDTNVMLNLLSSLGIQWKNINNIHLVLGNKGKFPVTNSHLFVNNAGTVIRSMTAVLALTNGCYYIDGITRMHERPIGDLVNALQQLGARIEYLEKKDYPPLKINARQNILYPSTISIQSNISSQFLTALLIALPNALALMGQKKILIKINGKLISRSYIQMTINLMQRFGVIVEHDLEYQYFIIPGAQYYSPGYILIEGDASSASYFLGAGAIAGGPVQVQGVGYTSIQGDIHFIDALIKMGAQCKINENTIEVSAPSTGCLRAINNLDCDLIPDAAMTLAVVAFFAQGRTCLRNIGSWRVKETDRIIAMTTELRKLGAIIEYGSDWLSIIRPKILPNNTIVIDTYNDHRIAMCFSLISLANIAIIINEPNCVRKTFPNYFDCFSQIIQ